MPRAIWTGSISFGLVNVPVKLFSAVSPKDVRFNQLEEGTGARIRQKRVSAETGEEVPVSVADLRREYREAVEHAIAEWRATLAPHGIDYVLVETDQPMVHALRAYLHKRERLG